MHILVIKAEIIPTQSFIVQPFTARVVRQVLFKIAKRTEVEWLKSTLTSSQPNKPYAYTPLYYNGIPLYKSPDNPRPIILEAGKKYSFRVSIILKKIEDISILYGFLDRLELYGDKKVDLIISKVEVCDERIVTLNLKLKKRIIMMFETPTLLQLPKPRKHSKVNRYLPFPVPGLIFRSLKEHWNTYADEKITSSSWRADYALVVESYRIKPCTVAYDAKRRIRGFVGWTQFRILTRGEKLINALSKLLAYAQLMNIGKSRSSGFGVVKVQPIKRHNSTIDVIHR